MGINSINGMGGLHKSHDLWTTFGLKEIGPVFDVKLTKPKDGVVKTTHEDGSTTVQTYSGGKLTREEVYDKDGKLSSVTCYSAKLGGSMPSSSTYIDKDGDGYYDEVIEKTYDENGEVTSETRKEKEDINGEVHLHPEAYKMDVGMLDFLTNGGNIK